MSENSTVFLVEDLQNDMCHEEGIFNKNGITIYQVESAISNIKDAMHFCQNYKIAILATQFTVLEETKNIPFSLGTFKNLHPILEKEGFRENSWGHDLLENLPKVTYRIKKWGISSFYQTEMEKYLTHLGAKEIVIGGFTTNGAIEMVARELIIRNYQITTLTDCVSAYSESLHRASLTNLGAFGKIQNSKEWMEEHKT